MLLAQLASLMGLLPPTPIPEPQALAPAATTALVDHTPAEPTPVTIIIQELDPSPTLDLPTFNMLPDIPLSTSTIMPSHTPSPLLPNPLDPPSPLMPTVSPDCLASVPDAATLADPTTPTHQALNAFEPGPDHLPADSPLTGHMSLNCPSNADHLGESGLQWHMYHLDWHIELVKHTSKDGGFPIYLPVPCNQCHIAQANNSVQSQAWVQALCMGPTPLALTPPQYPAKPIIKITQRPSHASKHACVKSPSPSPTPPPSTSGASSSNLAPITSTLTSPSLLPSLSNTKMPVVLHNQSVGPGFEGSCHIQEGIG
ncbi:hypothetical protein F5J12DRAFT_893960 [Pisolithus orientalis]|uniref:uncharacterized protein n=1 Tax=Pisolithus orientalis TaxID=936130 RepID=UPI0022253C37|nr:uncharacterized protein F5J12DRAFT_893960 [Pisolithus orientalis]KAI6002566.1 hypothetical protein F5J12DRAFT_893960 [Pisolithus orientalis]